jgi:ferredoxin-type protein NapH
LALTLLLGRVFCSWVCPVGLLLEATDKLRSGLAFLEIRSRNVRFPRSFKYLVLGGGLSLAAVIAVPVLGYVYPPAILSRELHDFVLASFDRAEMGRFSPSLSGLSLMTLFILAIVVFEVVVSRRWWCRYVCPGGALYSVIGQGRAVRVTLKSEACTGCTRCVPACPMGLDPMHDKMGMECDNCGVCIASCGDAALSYGLSGFLAGGRVVPEKASAGL